MVNLFSGHWLRKASLDENTFISVLIPARNEEKSISLILQDLIDLDYEQMEILVYDDSSSDRTPGIVRDFAKKDHRILLIPGVELPEGWIGKNHACFQLSKRARGERILFLDADVRVNKGLIRDSLFHLKKHQLSLLSLFPRQRMQSLAELITVPLMNVILLSLLPMPLIRRSRRTSLAAANGQFMMFDAEVYMKHQIHSLLRDQYVEDIHISRFMKEHNYRIDTLLSAGQVECRMYSGYREAITGFSRYTLAFFGGSSIALILYTLFTSFGFLFVALGISWMASMYYIAAVVLFKIMIAIASRQSVFWNVVLIPLQQVSMFIITIVSFKRKFQGSNTWKGRNIVFKGK
jgi:chlorobactene glucosyltransferase